MRAALHALDRLTALRVVPVIVIDDADDAIPLAEALARGGLPCAEITLRTERALHAIERLAASDLDVLVAAGTVRTPEQARLAIDAGARLLVSATFNPEVVEVALEAGVPILPGTCTPSEVEAATRMGLSAVKFFPAEAYGGVTTLRALAGPLPDVRFVPTGGITPATLPDYLALPSVLAVGGSWMASKDLIARRDWDAIAERTAETVRIARAS